MNGFLQGRRRFLACGLALAVATTGCATRIRTATPSYQGEPVKAVYVYSFLDVRHNELGPRFVEELHRQLASAFSAHQVRTAHLSFNDSPVSAEYSLSAQPAGRRGTTTRVPVAEVVADNQPQERAFGATHRVVIFPSSISRIQGSKVFQLRWDVYDSRTGKLEWSSMTSTSHMILLMNDENPTGRAERVLEAVVGEMLKSGMLQPPPVI